MLHTVWVVIAALLVTIPASSATIIVAMFSKSTSPLLESIIRWWARNLVKAAGITIRTENEGRLDPSQRYILIANHYSYFDIPCILAAIHQPIRFMAKASLFKIPIFGWALNRAGFIPVDRKNRRLAVKSFEMAAQRIRHGNTIVIFPEEGRSRERTMRPFQRGAFLLALKSELPIVPLAVDGTFDVFRVGARRVTPGVVTIRVGTPIPTIGRSVREKEPLARQARAEIETMLFGAPQGEPPAESNAPAGT
ncbi:MAG TPA: lysophospholipid acyltransferase family protein [Thermoanaerobaculia bacterium]